MLDELTDRKMDELNLRTKIYKRYDTPTLYDWLYEDDDVSITLKEDRIIIMEKDFPYDSIIYCINKSQYQHILQYTYEVIEERNKPTDEQVEENINEEIKEFFKPLFDNVESVRYNYNTMDEDNFIEQVKKWLYPED